MTKSDKHHEKENGNNPITKLIDFYSSQVHNAEKLAVGAIEKKHIAMLYNNIAEALIELDKDIKSTPTREDSCFGKLKSVDYEKNTITLSFDKTESFSSGTYEVSRVKD